MRDTERTLVALEAAFRKLAIRRSEAADGIPYETLIPAIARQLMLIRPNPGIHLPQAVTTKTAKRELRDLARKIEKTIKALRDLSPTARAAVNFQEAALRTMTTSLRILLASTESEVPESSAVGGRPKHMSVRKISEAVGQHYHALTGERATVRVREAGDKACAYGPFFDLMTEVFQVLNLSDSPEVWARHVADAQRNKAKRASPFKEKTYL